MMSRQLPATSHTSHLLSATHSLRAALSEAIARLDREGVPSSALAAELLLMHALGRDRTWIYAHAEHELDSATREQYFSLVGRRASGMPTQHLTGHQEFWGLAFAVTPDVLIPRPETEHVIEVAFERLGIRPGANSPRRSEEFQIADVGTGSGCIAIALAHELPSAHFVATDISAVALDVARRNAACHRVVPQITFIESNLLDGFLHGAQSTGHGPHLFDLIVSNPPYIGRREAATLPREVREHDPEVALFAGETGTELYAPLIAQAADLLKPCGFLVLELGHDSLDHVTRILSVPEWENVSVTSDLAGVPRVASAQRRRE